MCLHMAEEKSIFTFHNVSINTMYFCRKKVMGTVFTFHNVSINTLVCEYDFTYFRALHSTMFLLIPFKAIWSHVSPCTLHSTMFLLIPVRSSLTATLILFTFHNVSINTLIPGVTVLVGCNFTFHNVSINTHRSRTLLKPFLSLHSTMFLLILPEHKEIKETFRLYIPQCFY